MRAERSFEIYLGEDQRYLEKYFNSLLRERGGDENNQISTHDAVDVFSDLFCTSVQILLHNAPEGRAEEIRKDLVLYVETIRSKDNANH